ncbi:hypothetical protein K4F52_005255 [Lecanicillium sp. MT-2017a]|nr:hypothetical protein K4F52_005255 [Lecanicillium sp. MT-2017a]
MTLREQDLDVQTWADMNDVEPPAYEKHERLPPSYRDVKRPQDGAGRCRGESDSRIKKSLRKAFAVNTRFEGVTFGPSSSGSHMHSVQTGAVYGNYATYTETTACGPDVTQLQSCLCSQNGKLQGLYSAVKTDITASCGTIGTDDLASVSQLISKYCTQDADISFATPTTNIVNQMVTEVPEFTYLPGCAQSGISEALYSYAYSGCPSIDNMYAPCLCAKKGIVGPVQDEMSAEIRNSCSNGEDVTIAANWFTDYCNMNNGTTSFATPQGPPGDMTYYITALSQYKALNSCAQSGIDDAVMFQTYSACPGGPQALASCICIKSGVLGRVSQTLTSSVKFQCGNTANTDVASAAEVLDYYCQAAENKVVQSVLESVAETYPTQSDRPNNSRPSQSGGPAKTGGAGGSDQDGAASGDGGNADSGKKGGVSKAAVIAASVLGAVVLIAIIVGIALFVRRKNKKKIAAAAATGGPAGGHGHHTELHGTNKVELPGATGAPVSELGSKSPAPAPPMVQHQYGQQLHPQHSELYANNHPSPNQTLSPSEMDSPNYGYPQSNSPPSAMTSNSPYAQGTSAWGPPQSYELDSNHRQH